MHNLPVSAAIKIIAALTASLFFFITAYSQSCLPDGITFNSQEQIDNFPSNYPGCSKIEGDMIITNYSITSLDSLYVIDSIRGHLSISYTHLRNLEGLHNLAYVGDYISIENNDSLQSVSGLQQIGKVQGDLSLGVNKQLQSINGFQNIDSIMGSLQIVICHSLVDLNELRNLAYVGDNIRISSCISMLSIDSLHKLHEINGHLSIQDNYVLHDLKGLHNIDSIHGNLSIRNCDSVSTFEGLRNLKFVSGSVFINSNDSILSIGLDSLRFIGGDLTLTNNYSLQHVNCMNNILTSIGGSMVIHNNPELISLDGLRNLTDIAGDILIYQNDNLISITALENLNASSIHNLYIYDNPSLKRCQAIAICDYLQSPTGTVNIYNNKPGCDNPGEIAAECGYTIPCLPFGNYYFMKQSDIDDFQNDFPLCNTLNGEVLIQGSDITSLAGLDTLESIYGKLFIENNSSLSTLGGLNGLTTIYGNLYIRNNPVLLSLNGLERLDSITVNFYLGEAINGFENPLLNDISALSNLEYVGNNLFILANYSLTSLYGLNNLAEVGHNLHIAGNTNLESLLDLESLVTIGNNMSIAGNHELVNFEGLENITEIPGELLLLGNWGIQDFYGLHNLEKVNWLKVHAHFVENLSGFDNLRYVGQLDIGDWAFGGNENLKDLTGLESLDTVFGIWIGQNHDLESLKGLDKFNPDLLYQIVVQYNPKLSECATAAICEYLSDSSNAIFRHNDYGCDSREEVEEACIYLITSESDEKSETRLYPNPAINTLYFNNEMMNGVIHLSIYNQFGQLVAERELNGNTMDISHLPPGIYMVHIRSENGFFSEKIVIL